MDSVDMLLRDLARDLAQWRLGLAELSPWPDEDPDGWRGEALLLRDRFESYLSRVQAVRRVRRQAALEVK